MPILLGLKGGSYLLVENGILETLGHLKTLFLPLLSSVHRALGGLSYSNIVPVNRYVYLIILCPLGWVDFKTRT